jgi:hypothetical protein
MGLSTAARHMTHADADGLESRKCQDPRFAASFPVLAVRDVALDEHGVDGDAPPEIGNPLLRRAVDLALWIGRPASVGQHVQAQRIDLQ